MDSDEEISEYERIHNESVALLNKFLQEHCENEIENSVKDINDFGEIFKKPQRPKVAVKRRPRSIGGGVNLNSLLPKRSSNRLANKAPVSYLDMYEDNKENSRIFQEEFEEYVFKKKIYFRRSRSVGPQPSTHIITEDYISKVVYHVSSKVYCTKTGSSCHQCRQKTKDSKTVCKSGRCVGVRGQFCGTCLQNRYGENAEVALRNPTWSCPPCRGICNCSICRTRQGKRPTGVLTPIAQAHGHRSVKDYLISLKEKGLGEEFVDKTDFEYVPGDHLGFSESGDAYIISELDDDELNGFYNNLAITLEKEPILFKSILENHGEYVKKNFM